MIATAPKKKPAKKAARKSKTAKDIKVVDGKKAKAKKPKPEMVKVDKVEWEHHLECQKLAAEIDEMQGQYNDFKVSAKEIKEGMSGKQAVLRRMLRNGPERLPLFDAPPADAQKTETNGHAANGAATVDAWRSVKLADVMPTGKSASRTKALRNLDKAGVDTLGAFEDLRAKSFNGDWFSAVPNVGRDGADEVENAALDWLSKNRDAAVLAGANGKPEGEQASETTEAPQAEEPAKVEPAAAEAATETTAKPKRSRKAK